MTQYEEAVTILIMKEPDIIIDSADECHINLYSRSLIIM